MALSSGTRLGPYEILAAIGAGGMGEVYRARDTKLNRDVAIKILPDLFAHDPERLARFQREARVLASLNHPNIAQIFGLEESGGLRALVMELVAGEDLSQRLTLGAIPLADALAIARQIADALEAAHEQGIIHRDLKPANIKLKGAWGPGLRQGFGQARRSAEGAEAATSTRNPDDRREPTLATVDVAGCTVKVLDFGLAKALGPEGAPSSSAMNSPTMMSPAMTAQGIILGTAAYMSPEQARGKVVDKRADIWAFGCVVYETLTGKRAFEGETLTDVMAAVVKNDPDWNALPPDTPRSMRALLRRCLQKDPGKRLHDIADARIEIQEAISEPDTTAQTAPARRRAARWTVAIPWTLTAVLAVALTWLVIHALRVVSPNRPVTRVELILPSGVEPEIGPQAVAFSPDGTRVAFIGIVRDSRQIYVRRLDQSQFDALQVRDMDNANAIFFSPDSRLIGVILTTGVILTVSLDDGLAVPRVRDVEFNSGGAWGPDDQITFGRAGVLWQVPASGGTGTPSQLTRLDAGKGELLHAWPTAVAGGKAILFATTTRSSPGAAHIEALSLATGQRHLVYPSGTRPLYAASGHLIFFQEGSLLAAPFDEERQLVTGPAVKVIDQVRVAPIGAPMVAVSSSGSVVYMGGTAASQLVSVSREGVERPITPADRPYVFPRLQPPDGRSVLWSANGALWIQETARAGARKLTTDATTGNSFPAWTPDGKRVVFRTNTGLALMDADGSGRPQTIAGTSAADTATSVSRDGSTLAFSRLTSDTSSDVYLLSLQGEPKPRAIVATAAYEGGPQFSPDGKWLAYASDTSGQGFQVFVHPFPGPDQNWLAAPSGNFPRWNGKGTELFYRDGNKMMAVDVSARNGEPQFSLPRLLFEQRYEFGSGRTTPNYDVSPDGQRFVMVKGESGSSRLNVVLNWHDELARRAPPGR